MKKIAAILDLKQQHFYFLACVFLSMITCSNIFQKMYLFYFNLLTYANFRVPINSSLETNFINSPSQLQPSVNTMNSSTELLIVYLLLISTADLIGSTNPIAKGNMEIFAIVQPCPMQFAGFVAQTQ